MRQVQRRTKGRTSEQIDAAFRAEIERKWLTIRDVTTDSAAP